LIEIIDKNFITSFYKKLNTPKYFTEENLYDWLSLFYKVLSSFGEIPQSEVDKGIKRLKYIHIKKGDYFIKTGDIPDKMAFIARGIFRVFCNTQNGDEKILVFREEGNMLSAFSPFLKEEDSWYDIQALEDSDLLYIDINDYRKIINNNLYWQIINSRYIEMLFIEKEERGDGSFFIINLCNIANMYTYLLK
jgi:hypothetical protein